MKSKSEVSAGGVVFRSEAGRDVEVLVCKDAGYHKWVLPKGAVNRSESLEAAALREVQEEVGVSAHIVEALGDPEKYIFTFKGVRVFKTVYYFLMEYDSGDEKHHDHEMEEVRWVSLDDAIGLVAYEGAKRVLEQAKMRLDRIAKDL